MFFLSEPFLTDDPELQISQIIAHWNRLGAYIWRKIVLTRENTNFRFIAGKPDKTGSTSKIFDGPLIRRTMVDFLMNIQEITPRKNLLPVLLPGNR